ncbi:MAG TPA: YceI family protein [Bacteroidia bacterium]|nr:YceI family protein [Bacteroidia bacterium]
MNTINWNLDPSHSEVNFKVKHMMITNVNGKFSQFNLKASTTNENFENPQIEFRANTATVDTGSEQRDQHLKSADFFDSEHFPELNFVSTSFKKTGNNQYLLEGKMKIKDVEKPVTFQVEGGGLQKDPWGNLKTGFSIEGKINRKDFGLNWNAALETGGVLVSEEVKLNAEIQLVKA